MSAMNETNMLLKAYGSLSVAVITTKHFREALDKREFPVNVIGKATILAQSMNVGETIEVLNSEKFKATVEIKRVSKTVAILLTGWKGIRNMNKKEK